MEEWIMTSLSQLEDSIENVTSLESSRKQYISFTVEGQEYAIDIMSVREIKGWSLCTTLPNTPEYIRGVINLRGIVIPILDLRARFGRGFTQVTKSHVVMIVTVGERTLGILVDSVSDILTVKTDDIRAVPEVNAEQRVIFSGLVNVEDRLVGLLLLEPLMDHSLTFNPQQALVNEGQ
jgi:purine-binding chemotaxis protein CheW